jgi:DNA-binding NarL/FixJ family response regulator
MKILIADDHRSCGGLRQVLIGPSMIVVGEATNGDVALELARSIEWDLAVRLLLGRSGLDLLDSVKREFPGRPVLVMSMHSGLHGERAQAGAAGYISKAHRSWRRRAKVARGRRYQSDARRALALSSRAIRARRC